MEKILNTIIELMSNITTAIPFGFVLFTLVYLMISVPWNEVAKKFIGFFIVLEKEAKEEENNLKFSKFKAPITSTQFCASCGMPYIKAERCNHCGNKH